MDEPTIEQLQAYRRHTIERVTVEETANELGIAVRTVHYWCKAVAEWMRAYHMDQIASLRAVLTDRIDYIYSESVRGYKASKRDRVVTTETEKDTGSESKVQRTPTPAGDPTFLRIAKDAIMAHAELWHANMSAADKGTGIRAAGRTQLDMIDAQLEKLKKVRRQITGQTGEPVNGDGDRA